MEANSVKGIHLHLELSRAIAGASFPFTPFFASVKTRWGEKRVSGACEGGGWERLVTPCDLHPRSYPCPRGLAVCLAFGMASLDHLLGPMNGMFPGSDGSLAGAWGSHSRRPEVGGRWESRGK